MMSRCFPYPPHNRYGNEALIEPIKLRKESENAKVERKNEKRRGNKEKKREKIETLKLNASEISCHDKAHKGDKSWIDSQGGYCKKIEDEAEQLERSSLTEEHGQPIGVRQPSCSSDSTENSCKRKRDESPIVVIRGHGNIIRIRLSSQKNKESDASAFTKQVCSATGRVDVPSKPKQEIASRTSQEDLCCTTMRKDDVGPVLPPVPVNEQRCSISGCTKEVKQHCVPSTSGLTSFERKMAKKSVQYKDLTENWAPPALKFEQEDHDDDWLFDRKNQVNKFDVSCNMSICSSLLPRAQYLPEVGIYALPFTVPF